MSLEPASSQGTSTDMVEIQLQSKPIVDFRLAQFLIFNIDYTVSLFAPCPLLHNWSALLIIISLLVIALPHRRLPTMVCPPPLLLLTASRTKMWTSKPLSFWGHRPCNPTPVSSPLRHFDATGALPTAAAHGKEAKGAVGKTQNGNHGTTQGIGKQFVGQFWFECGQFQCRQGPQHGVAQCFL